MLPWSTREEGKEKTEPSRRCSIRTGEKPWEISLGLLEDGPTEHIGSESGVAWAVSWKWHQYFWLHRLHNYYCRPQLLTTDGVNKPNHCGVTAYEFHYIPRYHDLILLIYPRMAGTVSPTLTPCCSTYIHAIIANTPSDCMRFHLLRIPCLHTSICKAILKV